MKGYGRMAVVRGKLRWRTSTQATLDAELIRWEPTQLRVVVGSGKQMRIHWGPVPEEHRPVSHGALYHPAGPVEDRLNAARKAEA